MSKRTPAAVLADLHVDDLSVLQYVHASIDTVAHTVTARALGIERRAVYREGLGCALALDDLTPPRLLGSDRDPDVATGFSESGGLTPTERSVAGHPRAQLDVAVARAFDEPDPRYPRRTRAVVVMQGGRIIAERYAAGNGPGTALAGWSMSKSVMNALVGVLVRDGRLAVDARSDSGMNPGSNIISVAIRNVLHDRSTYLAFPKRALFDPLGMSSAVLETDAAGTFIGSSYIYATARERARFGMLYLRDGIWNGARILPPGWVDYTRTPAPADEAKRYGAHFWLETPLEYGGSNPRLPVPTLHAAGHEGQFVTIVPSRDLVIVRLGRTRYPHAWDQAAFVRDVLASVDRATQ